MSGCFCLSGGSNQSCSEGEGEWIAGRKRWILMPAFFFIFYFHFIFIVVIICFCFFLCVCFLFASFFVAAF